MDARNSRHPRPGPDQSARRLTWWLVLCVAALTALYAYLYGVFGGHVAPTVQLRFIGYAVAFALYFITVWWICRSRLSRIAERQALVVITAGAIAFRFVILAGLVPPNPDLGRHLWEGKVLLEGFNPYAAAPSDEIYDGLRETLKRDGSNLYSGVWLQFEDIRSVYGPVATVLFAIPHLMPFDDVLCLRWIMTLLDIGAIFLLTGVLVLVRRSPLWVVVYAWSPVCINAFADRGQVDAAMVFLVVLVVWLALKRSPILAGIAFAAAILTKVSPLLLLLPLLRFAGWRLGLGFTLGILAGAAPFAGAGLDGLSGFATFADEWQCSDSLYSIGLWLVGPLAGPAAGARVVKALLGLAGGLYAIYRTLKADTRDRAWVMHCIADISAAVILLSPVTYPWYCTLMIAFVSFRPRASLLALGTAPMLWYLKFLQADPGTIWQTIAHAVKRWQEPWRVPAFAIVGALFLREALVSRAKKRLH